MRLFWILRFQYFAQDQIPNQGAFSRLRMPGDSLSLHTILHERFPRAFRIQELPSDQTNNDVPLLRALFR